MRIRVWHGWRAVHNGKDVSKFGWLEFDGELIGTLVHEVDEDRTDELAFYRLYDGRIVVAEHRYGDWEKGGVDYGVVSVYSDINEAAKRGWRDDLVRIGAYEAPVRDLDAWLGQFEEDDE
jgi:hypothetical protein